MAVVILWITAMQDFSRELPMPRDGFGAKVSPATVWDVSPICEEIPSIKPRLLQDHCNQTSAVWIENITALSGWTGFQIFIKMAIADFNLEGNLT